jgi:tetratricopeptide (TPR) repeat protein
MPQAELLREQAETCMAEAPSHEREGRAEEALAALRRAVLLYAAADSTLEPGDKPGPLKRARADACRLFGVALATAGRHAEAANIYQEATDLYGLFEDDEARRLAKECARNLLNGVAALRAQPRERLHLLIAHYERVQQQLALEPDTEAKQAECAVHIARIYQRRDRPAESVERYWEALDLYSRSGAPEEVQLARAECHHRIATLFAVHLDNPREAIRHYRNAIALYEANEPAFDAVQPSLETCRAALARTEATIARQGYGRDREWSRE